MFVLCCQLDTLAVPPSLVPQQRVTVPRLWPIKAPLSVAPPSRSLATPVLVTTGGPNALNDMEGVPHRLIVPAEFVTIDTGSGVVHQAPAFGEEKLLAGAHLYQQATDWHNQNPPETAGM